MCSNLFKTQLSGGIFAMCILFGIINELKQPQIASAYNVDYSLMGTLVDGLEKLPNVVNERSLNMKVHQKGV